MGAKYLGRNVDALATEGRLVIIGMQGGTKGELDIGALLRKRGAVIATTLRGPAGRGEGGDLRGRSSSTSGRWSADGQVRPIVHTTLPLERGRRGARADGVERAHRQDRAHRLTVRVGRIQVGA